MKTVVLILAGLFLLEMVVALIAYPLKSKKRSRRSYYWVFRNAIYRFDPLLGYTLKPNLRCNNPTTPIPKAPRKIMNFDIRTDRNGFLFTEDIQDLRNRYKIIFCLGDSITMGSESPHDKTYPALLDALVRRNGRICVNASVGGYRSYHQLLFLKNKILPFKPEAVILYTGWNDFADYVYDFYEPYNQFKSCLSYGLPANRIEAFLDHSALFHVSKKLVFAAKGGIRRDEFASEKSGRFADVARSNVWMKEWTDNIGRIIDLCGENRVRCYILSPLAPVYKGATKAAKDLADAELNMGGNFDAYIDFIESANKELSKLSVEKGARFIDVRGDIDAFCRAGDSSVDFKKRFSLFVDRAHFTKEGNKLIANLVYGNIQKDLQGQS